MAREDAAGTIPVQRGAKWYFWWRAPDAWDTRWRTKCRVPGAPTMPLRQLRDYLAAEAAKCNAALQQVYANAPFSVRMADDQVRPPAMPRSKPLYLCFCVQRR